MSTEVRVVLITAPTMDEAARLARVLVEERLAACANCVPGLRSIYRWEGKVHDDPEVLLVVKTRRDLLERLTARVCSLHSYQNPEVVALAVEGGSADYLAWVDRETS